jgi:hypothetical protein
MVMGEAGGEVFLADHGADGSGIGVPGEVEGRGVGGAFWGCGPGGGGGGGGGGAPPRGGGPPPRGAPPRGGGGGGGGAR